MGETADYDKSATPTAHATTHQLAGSDVISVLGLSGLLADPQTPLAHKASHQLAGSDALSVAGLSGLLADPQNPLGHKTSHQLLGSDALSVAGLSGLLADPQTPLAHTHAHSSTTGLDYASASHTGFEPTVTKGNLTAASTKITIGGTGTGALIGAGASIDVNQANLDHGSIAGLTDDDHSQYALLAGRAGGQVLYGGNAANDDLTVEGTSHTTRTTSHIIMNPDGGTVLIGISSSAANVKLELPGSTINSSAKFGSYEIQSYAVNNAWLSENCYYGPSGFTYRANGYAALAYFYNGGFEIRTAPSGTAGNTFSPTSFFNVLNDGKTGIGMVPSYSLDVLGNIRCSTGFGCNGTTPQTAYASGAALAAYTTGAFGLNSDANMSALHDLVVKIRAALIANGIMS